MKRLQISIQPELDAELDRVAHREGISKAEVVRRCVREGIQPAPSFEDDALFRLFGTAEGGLRPGETIDDVVYGPRDA